MRILLLGKNSQLAHDILFSGKQKGWDMVAYGREEFDAFCFEKKQALTSFEGDLVINCIAFNQTEAAEKDPKDAFWINGTLPGFLGRLFEEKKIPLWHFSTDYVFNGEKTAPYIEEDSTSPLNLYGASKLLGEQLVLSEGRGLHSVWRVSSLFGVAGSSSKGGNFIETVTRLLRERGRIEVVDDVITAPTFTGMLAELLLEALEKGIPPGLYHAALEGESSWFSLAQEIQKKRGLEGVVLPLSQNAQKSAIRRPKYSVLSSGKLKKWVKKIPSWQEGLDVYIEKKSVN